MKIEQPPRIALIGYGKMGREIESAAREFGVPVTMIIDTNQPDKETSINARTLADVDVCIEFTRPDAVLANIRAIAKAGKSMVVGTTGWSHALETVTEIVRAHDVGLVHASNFSLGMNLFYLLVRHAGVVFESFDSYDCSIHEAHHAQKADTPSGTALHIAAELMRGLKSKTGIAAGNPPAERDPRLLQITSARVGAVPGTHQVLFDSPADSIELVHTARNRRGFAEGALIAAAWIKNRKGMHTMEDVLHDVKSL